MKFPTIFRAALLVAAAFCFTTVNAQEAGLTLRDTSDGYTGVYTHGKGTVALSHRETGDKSFISRIQDPAGRTIAECVRAEAVTTVTIQDVTLTFRTDKNSIQAGKNPGPSDSDKLKLERFAASEESALIRQSITELIRQRRDTPAASGGLKGFVIIAMVLGDGPGTADEAKGNAGCKSPGIVQMYASYNPTPVMARKGGPSPASSNKKGADEELCKGCCGAGCLGCTGCYTSACWAHDHCVEQYGHIACLGLLAAAVASILQECSIV